MLATRYQYGYVEILGTSRSGASRIHAGGSHGNRVDRARSTPNPERRSVRYSLRRQEAQTNVRREEGNATMKAMRCAKRYESLLVAHHRSSAGTFHVSTHTTIYAWVERTDPISNDAATARKAPQKIRLSNRRRTSREAPHQRAIGRCGTISNRNGGRYRERRDRKSALVVHTERKSGSLPHPRPQAVPTRCMRRPSTQPSVQPSRMTTGRVRPPPNDENDTNAEVFLPPGHPEDRAHANTILEDLSKRHTVRYHTNSDVARAVWNLNHRPRKRLPADSVRSVRSLLH